MKLTSMSNEVSFIFRYKKLTTRYISMRASSTLLYPQTHNTVTMPANSIKSC